MNVVLHQPHTRALLLTLLLFAATFVAVQGQSGGGYKNLITAENSIVSDTISGLNLTLLEVSPTAQHGDDQQRLQRIHKFVRHRRFGRKIPLVNIILGHCDWISQGVRGMQDDVFVVFLADTTFESLATGSHHDGGGELGGNLLRRIEN